MRHVLVLAILAAVGLRGQMIRVPSGEIEVTDQVTTLKLKVRVSEFLLGATEVTQKEYRALMGASPAVYPGDDRPVENVSWWDAIRYANLRSRAEGLTACYELESGQRRFGCTGYRLPTDAEWTLASGPKPAAAELARIGRLGSAETGSTDLLQPLLGRGTTAVGALAADARGFRGLWGNVWEWCEDWFNPLQSPDSLVDPMGPLDGMMRVVHGGSFVTMTGSWGRGFRSSMKPEERSRFTGFRLARSGGVTAAARTVSLERFQQAPEGYREGIGKLAPLGGKVDRAALQAKWQKILSTPRFPTGPVAARLVREVRPRNFVGSVYEVETEPGVWEKACVLRPRNPSGKPLPVVIVPFYDIDTPVGGDFGGRSFASSGVNSFAYTAAQHGYIAVAVRWYGESDGEWYSEAVANLMLRHPGSTGLGKWVADSRRLVDFIETLPDVDRSRIGMFGHSLGGKMTLYAAAFDERIRAAVSSELGIGFAMSNYDDYWYLGDRVKNAPAGTDQHELMALVAPRPYLLIGGDKFDGNESWHYVNAARAVYQGYGRPEAVGMFNHHAGHTPTEEAVRVAFEWLDHWLGQP